MEIGDLVQMRQLRAPFDDIYGMGVVIDIYPDVCCIEYKVQFKHEALWVEEPDLMLVSRMPNGGNINE